MARAFPSSEIGCFPFNGHASKLCVTISDHTNKIAQESLTLPSFPVKKTFWHDTNYQNDPSKNKIQKHPLRKPTEYLKTSTTTTPAVDAKRRQLMPPNVKGIQDFRVQSQGTKMPSSTCVKGGAKGNSTVNFQPFPLNQNVCYPKNLGRSVK